ncbi:MAG TPA: efflux RND transporter periplasmic adaptor subunit [Myxococcales bacterium]|nr:efflux RND transporter periplasmic adaptor subunit [Myxococcales bacterium]
MTSGTRVLLLLLVAACARRDSSSAVHAGDLRLQIRLDPDPPVAADNVLHVELMDAGGNPVDGARLGFASNMPAMGAMPEMKGGGDVQARGAGKYDVAYTLSMLGDWTLTLRIDAPGHPQAELHLKVAPPHKGYAVETRAAAAPRESGPRTLALTPERQQLIGVVYAKVEKRPLRLDLRASGRVEVDETRVRDVVLKYDAYVEELVVNQTGQRVRKGEPLLILYSPELLSAEQEYLVALRGTGAGGSEQLARAAEDRLRRWGLDDGQLAALRNRGNAEPRVTVRSPAEGTVLEKVVVAGTKAMAGMVLYRIGDLGRIWVIADLFESDAPYLEAGLRATLTLPFAGGRALDGTVEFVYPTVDPKTRSVRARLVFPNARLSLKPGMFADVRVQVPLGSRLSVPDDALLASGEHRYAFVKRGEGELEAREVKVGAVGDYDEVLEGLAEGEEVATQATFLLSSEAQLRSALPRWNRP